LKVKSSHELAAERLKKRISKLEEVSSNLSLSANFQHSTYFKETRLKLILSLILIE
jgi:hypothetical protein